MLIPKPDNIPAPIDMAGSILKLNSDVITITKTNKITHLLDINFIIKKLLRLI